MINFLSVLYTLAESLCTIFNRSIEMDIFPDEWKCAKVLPLFKQGEHTDMNNYRPISIIPVVVKVFERIIYDQAYAFLTNNNILSNCQSGFDASTLQSLLFLRLLMTGHTISITAM